MASVGHATGHAGLEASGLVAQKGTLRALASAGALIEIAVAVAFTVAILDH